MSFDAAYGVAFAHPLVVQLVVERHDPRWAERIDFSTLDHRPTKVFSPDKLKARNLDLLFAFRAEDGEAADGAPEDGDAMDGWLEALVLLEVQGRSDKHMATRIDNYGGLAIQQERRLHTTAGRTPPKYRALKFVLHHGDHAWTAPLHSEELHGKKGPTLYVLVPPRPLGLPDPELHDLPGLLLSVGRNLTRAEMRVEVRLLRQAADLAGRADVDEVVVDSLRRLLELRGYPEEIIQEMDGMKAAVTMYERHQRESELVGERRGWREGRREGRQEGRREGRMEGRRRLCCRLAARKFGPETGRELAAVLDRVADTARLDEAADVVMDCDSPEALLRAVRPLAGA